MKMIGERVSADGLEYFTYVICTSWMNAKAVGVVALHVEAQARVPENTNAIPYLYRYKRTSKNRLLR